MKIQEKINSIILELENYSINNKQRKRYLESYLGELNKYKEKNPDKDELPSPLELYCDLNPDALECRIYDD